MWRKVDSGPLWLQPASNDALIYSPPEREELIQEAIDCLDYAEEKLLELEYSPKNAPVVRRLQSTFVRLYELSWVLRCYRAFAIVQRVRAFLTYARQGSLQLKREEIGRMFEVCSVLQDILLHLRGDSFEEPLRVVPETSPREVALPEALEGQRALAFDWCQQRLVEVEKSQQSRVCGRSPRAGSLFPHPPKTPAPLSQVAADASLGPADNEDCFGSAEALSDSQELRSLRQLVGELDKSVNQLQDNLSQEQATSAGVSNALQDLLSLKKALHQRVDSMAATPGPTSSLFGLVIGNQDQYFCIPTSSLLALIPAAEVQLHQWNNEETHVMWEDEAVLPLLALGDLLPASDPLSVKTPDGPPSRSHSIPGVAAGPVASSQAFCVILRTESGPKAVWVEHLLREMMVELLYTDEGGEPHISGECQLPDGQSARLLDIEGLYQDQHPAASCQ